VPNVVELWEEREDGRILGTQTESIIRREDRILKKLGGERGCEIWGITPLGKNRSGLGECDTGPEEMNQREESKKGIV